MSDIGGGEDDGKGEEGGNGASEEGKTGDDGKRGEVGGVSSSISIISVPGGGTNFFLGRGV